MKKLLLSLFVIVFAFAGKAQDLSPDQNPNYKVSMEKYKTMQTNLQTTMNTTVQNTYKAYDWRTAKNERKAERLSYQRERRQYSNFNNGYYNRYDDYDEYYSPYQYRNNNYGHRRFRW